MWHYSCISVAEHIQQEDAQEDTGDKNTTDASEDPPTATVKAEDVEEKQDLVQEDQETLRRSTRSRQKSMERKPSTSDDESDGETAKIMVGTNRGPGGINKTTRSQSRSRSKSRIDRWKAKHEAMLKQVSAGDEKTGKKTRSSSGGQVTKSAGCDKDEADEEKDYHDHVDGDKEDAKSENKKAGQLMNKKKVSNKSDDEIPSLDEAAANGVCIDFDQKKNISKPHTRQQQALSV